MHPAILHLHKRMEEIKAVVHRDFEGYGIKIKWSHITHFASKIVKIQTYTYSSPLAMNQSVVKTLRLVKFRSRLH